MVESLSLSSNKRLNNYSSSGIAFKAVPVDNKPREYNSEFYIDQKGAEALKLKSFVANPLEIDKPIAFDDYMKKLNKAGLVEDRDYNVYNYSDGSVSLFLRKSKAHATVIRWEGGKGIDNYACHEEQFYSEKNGKETLLSMEYNRDGILNTIEETYYNIEKHKDLLPENIDINTKPDDYIKTLEQKNIKFEVDKDNSWTMIVEFDKNNRPVKTTIFGEEDDEKSIMQHTSPNSNGSLTHCIHLFSLGDYTALKVSDDVREKGIRKNVKY